MQGKMRNLKLENSPMMPTKLKLPPYHQRTIGLATHVDGIMPKNAQECCLHEWLRMEKCSLNGIVKGMKDENGGDLKWRMIEIDGI